MISRRAMMQGLRQVDGALPLRCSWNVPAHIQNIFGKFLKAWCVHPPSPPLRPPPLLGEQGDTMMPVLFSVGQHHFLEMVNRSFRDDQKVMALLDDIYFGWPPNKVGGVYVAIEEASQTHAHGDKTKVWNAFGCSHQGQDVSEGRRCWALFFGPS